MTYYAHLAVLIGIFAIVAMSLNVAVGFCGRLTLAQAGFFAIGAYAHALLSMTVTKEFFVGAVFAAAVGAMGSLLVSLPAWRLRSDFFVIVTLAVQVVIQGVLQNWTSSDAPPGTWANLTNGPFGLAGIPSPRVAGFAIRTPTEFVILTAVVVAACFVLLRRLLRSPWARALRAMRDNELAAQGLGLSVRMLTVQAFAVSCGVTAVGGALYASYVSYLDPRVASLDQSILMLSMVLVGGVGNTVGPFVGAGVLILLPEALRRLNVPDAIAGEVRLMIFGVLLVGLTHLRPQGIAGTVRVN